MNDEKNFRSYSDSLDVDKKDEVELNINDEIEQDRNSEDEIKNKKSELEDELEDFKNKLLRISAEYDNYRKRTLREKEELYGNACLDVITQVLPVLDNLERAMSSESDLESLKKGINMVINLFLDVLNRLGVKEIESEGEFNPNLHEAVAHVSDANLGKNTIVEVLQKGYIRNEKVIRHSMVKVAN